MSSPAPSRARLIVAGAALAVCLALAAGPAWSAPVDAVVGLGAAGVILFGAALAFVQARLIPWALGCVAAEFIIWLYVRDLR
ncbi:MAG TPA: hypothetical protein VFI22_04580, partial [Thermomicrobiales bacterium]|nr:hypothetical protein [Thermomicrobiales bacterium]